MAESIIEVKLCILGAAQKKDGPIGDVTNVHFRYQLQDDVTLAKRSGIHILASKRFFRSINDVWTNGIQAIKTKEGIT